MGYIFLSITLMAGAIKGYCGKQTSEYTKEYKDVLAANIIRMSICIIFGLIVIIFTPNTAFSKITFCVLLITILSGIANAVFVISWLLSVKENSYMMVNVFCMIGVSIPLLGSSIIYKENITITQCLGLLLLFFAVYIMCSYNNSIKPKLTLSSFFWLLLCGISDGFISFSQKLYTKQALNNSIAVFNVYTYLFSVILLVVLFLLSKNLKPAKKTSLKPIFGYVLIMSICLFLFSYFNTLSAKYLSSVQLYPLVQGGGLIISTVMSIVLFKEKLNYKCVVGLILSFISLIIINIAT